MHHQSAGGLALGVGRGGKKPDVGHMNHEVSAAEVRRVHLATPHINGDLEAPAL